MSPHATTVLSCLIARGACPAKQIASSVDLPIETTYAALVELEGSERAYIATQGMRWRSVAGERCRLWCARPAEFWTLEAA